MREDGICIRVCSTSGGAEEGNRARWTSFTQRLNKHIGTQGKLRIQDR